MKSKVLVCGALAAALTMSVVLPGCANATRNEEDMNQIIATVDITKSDMLAQEGLAEYASCIAPENIIKRDLMAAYYNVGYSYIQSGSSVAEVFEMLVEALTSTAVVSQYATLSLIADKCESDSSFLQKYNAAESDVEKYELLLEGETAESDDGESSRVLLARYSFYSSINSSIDSIEQGIIDEDEDDSSSSGETRTVPGGAGEEVENYLPLDEDGNFDYGIYTGYSGEGYSYLIGDSGAYADDELEGSTQSTRRRAYAQFVAGLKNNFLIGEDEDVRDIMAISYISDEYLSQLQQQVINEYYERYQAEQEALIDSVDENGVYTFIRDRYNTELAEQTISNSSASAFETSMGSMSDTSFVLYAPATDGTDGGTYGFVYNILLPFSAKDNTQVDSSDTSAQYYLRRQSLLADITAGDQRGAWFNGATDYSFDASGSNIDYYGKTEGRNYLFFEDNLTNTDRYKTLEKYTGLYSYNGSVYENEDETYTLVPAKVDIDGFLKEFKSYVDFVMGGESVTYDTLDSYNVTDYNDYYTDDTKDLADDSLKKIDYSKFVYATGKVDIGSDTSISSLFVKDSLAYKALCAVNELQYAYTTDTGVLSQYIGYSISAYETDYVPEFEYAAQEAINDGAGTIYVCGGDYGWHVIYVTATFETAGGAVYGQDIAWTAEEVLKEGTFQNMYYNFIKDSAISDVTTARRSMIVDDFGGETTVTLHKDAYSDLLEAEEE